MTRENLWEKYGQHDHKNFMHDLTIVIEEEQRPKSEKAQMVLEKCCEVLGELASDVRSRSRDRGLTDARFVFYRIAQEQLSMLSPSIGRFMGRKHCGVLHGIKQSKSVPELIKKHSQCIDYVIKFL